MGQPAEARNLVRHLINVSNPYTFDNPVWALICQGVTELTENFEADTEDVQYICETTKTVNVKGYTVGFDLEMGYMKDNAIQQYINRIIAQPPTGLNTACDYIRFNVDEVIEGTTNVFKAVRRQAVVYPTSIGGAADDVLTSGIHISGTSDPVVGYVTVNNGTFTWSTSIPTAPVISSPLNGATGVSLSPTISGTGVSGATLVVKNTAVNPAVDILSTTVNSSGNWSGTPSSSLTASTEYTISATQTLGGVSSPASTSVTFTTDSE